MLIFHFWSFTSREIRGVEMGQHKEYLHAEGGEEERNVDHTSGNIFFLFQWEMCQRGLSKTESSRVSPVKCSSVMLVESRVLHVWAAFPHLTFLGGMHHWGSQCSAEAGDSSHNSSIAFSGTLHGWQQRCSLWLCINAGCAISPTKPELIWDVCTSFGQKHWEAQLSEHGWYWAGNNASINTEVCTAQLYEHICTSVSSALPAFQDVNCQNAVLIPGGSMQSERIEAGQTHQ